MQKTLSRRKLHAKGLVQGIGFRPFVFNLAHKHLLTGFVCNLGGAVDIEIQGELQDIENFIDSFHKSLPPLASITELNISDFPVNLGESEFQIIESRDSLADSRQIPLDTAVCEECLKELFSEENRRYQYPFINCTNCGPRFTIIEKLPYDRQSTTMRAFAMCPQCLQEYKTPSDRRFHAQPNACELCGPKLTFKQQKKTPIIGSEALQRAQQALLDNEIIAVKGLGGYHLMGNAKDDAVVKKIRNLKNRKDKPLAVMFHDIQEVEAYCQISTAEKELLNSPVRPIVLLKQRDDHELSKCINRGLDEIGAMLPNSPLHYLLLGAINFPLIATSANDEGLPIITRDDDAEREFVEIGMLAHDRQILSGYDDSIMRFDSDRKMTIRRARGMTPSRLILPFDTGKSAIAFGAHLKNTFCITRGNTATISQHLGDIETLERMENYENTFKLYLDLFECKPDLLICDLHPDYKTTQIAEKMSESLKLPLIRVQHHHAHAVSVMTEHKIQKAVAVVFDGMGLGIDGNIWGGEFLLCTHKEFTRLAHLENVPLPGGDLAAKNPWRMALGFIEQMESGQNEFVDFLKELESIQGKATVNTVRKQIRGGINCPLTSSCGRLFDAAAVLIDHRCKPTYEGQAAMELEALARQCKCREHRLYDFAAQTENNVHIVKSTSILRSMQTALNSGISKACAARVFHQTLSAAITDVLVKIRSNIGVGDVCLSGGVFQNTLLLKYVRENLEDCGFNVFTPSTIPANDGGLSFGQAVIGLSNFA